ncbi:hypothetical protein A2U01_0099489, partial [Trifolium medium]|nr:hypothetical protein [Trifolium medium]
GNAWCEVENSSHHQPFGYIAAEGKRISCGVEMKQRGAMKQSRQWLK